MFYTQLLFSELSEEKKVYKGVTVFMIEVWLKKRREEER